MKKTLTTICAVLLVLFLMIPMAYEADDGGTRQYVAPLYSITKQHSMYTQDGESGYLTGTVVRVLFFEVYDDVVFVPEESVPENPNIIAEI